MINKIKYGLLIAGVIILFGSSCGKKLPACCDISRLSFLESWVTDGPWQLISATRYNGSAVINRYKGNTSDTLDFGYAVTASLAMRINGVYNVCRVQWPLSDSTIKFTAACRPGYNDTLHLNSFGEDLLVFKVKFDSANIHCWELDSLKKMYFWRP